MAESAVIRRRLVLYGWVQGVGLRYRARHAAERFGCTGWVRNEYDGSVILELQGTRDAIEQVLLAIERGSYVRIENFESFDLPPDRDERGFYTR